MEALSELPLLVALLGITVLTARWWGSWVQPAPLMGMQWLVVCAAALLLPHGLRPVGAAVLLLTLLGVCAFVAGALLVPRGPTSPSDFLPAPTQFRRTRFADGLLLLALLGLPIFLQRAVALADAAAYTESFYINLRIALTGELDDAQSFGPAAYLIPASFCSALLELATSPRRWPTWRFWLAFSLALVYAVMATGRTFVFLLGIGLAFLCLHQGRLRPLQLVFVAVAFLAGAFIGLGWLANKIGVESQNIDALAAEDALALYLLGSLSAMDVQMAEPLRYDWGANTFRTFLAIGQALGLDVEVPVLVKPYVFVPQPTNVFTAFLPYWQDFGWSGVVGVFGLLGWAHAALNRAAQVSRDPRLQVLASLAMYPLLMQFFQDQYFSLLTTWVTFALLVWPSLRRTSP